MAQKQKNDGDKRPVILGANAYSFSDLLEARGWSWSYWQFDSDFIVYDIDKDQWVPPIRNALIPKTK